jgi:predicted aspartyl protease
VIDQLLRPIVRVSLPQPGSDDLLCLVDTGFTGFLLLERSKALGAGFRLLNEIEDQIVLGDGSIRLAGVARGNILWLGSTVFIDAHIVPDAPRARRSSPEHQIDAMIGTALLDGLQVVLDFWHRRVTIQQSR